MSDPETTIAPTEYRYAKRVLAAGIASTVFYGAIFGATSVIALENPDGSLPNPVRFAILCGMIGMCLSLTGVWLILEFYCHRVSISSRSVRVSGCFGTREVQFAAIRRAEWKTHPRGRLILYDTSGKAAIGFSNYTVQDRTDMVHRLRELLAEKPQEGWEHFESRCVPTPNDYEKLRTQMRRDLRFTFIAWAVALPLCYGILIAIKLLDLSPGRTWASVVLIPLAIAGAFLGLMWIAMRATLVQAR